MGYVVSILLALPGREHLGRATPETAKQWRLAGRIVVKFGCFPRAPFCALFCAHCYSH